MRLVFRCRSAHSIGFLAALAATFFISGIGTAQTGPNTTTEPLSTDASSNEATTDTREYRLEGMLYSLVPGKGPEQWRDSGRLSMVAQSSRLVIEMRDFEEDFVVRASTQYKGGKYGAVVTLIPGAAKANVHRKSFEVDLSDFRPQGVELFRAADGRVHMFSLVPSIVVTRASPPRPVDGTRLNHLMFVKAPVVLNESKFLGTIDELTGANEFAWIEVAGMARIEFSLIPMRDSKPLGVLKDGLLHITNADGTTVDIYDVLSDFTKSPLPDGPYKVWVRWKPATETVEQAVSRIKKYAEAAKAEEFPLPSNNRMEGDSYIKRVVEGKTMTGFGASVLSPADRADP